MQHVDTLCALSIGQEALVTALDHPLEMRRRLQDMGLIIGTPVKCLHKGPCGDPVAYQIRGAVIALRAEDAALVSIANHA